MIYARAFSAGAAVVATARPHPNESLSRRFFLPAVFFLSSSFFSFRRCRVVVIIVVVVVAVAVAFAAVVLYNIVSLCEHEFFFSLPEAIKMMDDFPRGVPCRVVLSLSLWLPLSFSHSFFSTATSVFVIRPFSPQWAWGETGYTGRDRGLFFPRASKC